MLKKSQLAGANYAYTKHPFPYFVASMQRLGLTSIELYAASPHLYPYDYTPQQALGVKKQLDAAGIRVVCLTAEQCMIPVSLAIEDSAVRRRSLEYYARAAELAAVFEAPCMHMVAGAGYIGSNPADDYQRSLEGIDEVAGKAQSLGVKIALEADRGSPVKNTADIRRIIDTLGSARVGGLLDTNAVYHAGEQFEDALRLLGGDLLHMHFIDITPEKGCLVPGSGQLPMAGYLAALASHGYKGYLTPELWGWTYTDRAEPAMRESAAFCWQYMQ